MRHEVLEVLGQALFLEDGACGKYCRPWSRTSIVSTYQVRMDMRCSVQVTESMAADIKSAFTPVYYACANTWQCSVYRITRPPRYPCNYDD